MKPNGIPVERRRERRHNLSGNPIAVMRPEPSDPGRLCRLGRFSAEIEYLAANGEVAAPTEALSILAPDFTRGLYLRGLPVRTVSDVPQGPGCGPVSGRRILRRVVCFERLSADQQTELEAFILSHKS
jgi:hypothetical protein